MFRTNRFCFSRNAVSALPLVAALALSPLTAFGLPFSMPTVTAQRGAPVTLNLIDAATTNLEAATVIVVYNTTQLAFQSAVPGDLTSDFSVVFDEATAGEVLISLATFTAPVNQLDGSILGLQFVILPNATIGTTTVTVDCARDASSGQCIDYALGPVTGNVNIQERINNVPEPGSLSLAAIGLTILARSRRKSS